MFSMKIAVFQPRIYAVGGAERVLLEWLKRTEFDADVYTWDYQPEKTYRDLEKFDIVQLLPEGVPSRVPRKGIVIATLGLFTKLPEKYDVTLTFDTGFGAPFLLRNGGKVNVGYIHTPLRITHPDEWPFMKTYRVTNPIKRIYLRFVKLVFDPIEKVSWGRYTALAYNSELVRRRAHRKGLVKKGVKEAVIYPGVELPDVRVKPKEDGKVRIVYVSRFSYVKRQIEAILGVKKLREKYNVKAELYLVGATTPESYSGEVLSLAERFEWVNVVTNAPDDVKWEIIADSDIGLFTAWNEDFGIVPLEYAAVGIPVVGTKGGYVEVLEKVGYPFFLIPEAPLDGDRKRAKKGFVENITDTLHRAVKTLPDIQEKTREAKERFLRLDLSWDRFARELDTFIWEQIST